MSENSTGLTPAELLAELQSEAAASIAVATPADAFDLDALDFSDLEESDAGAAAVESNGEAQLTGVDSDQIDGVDGDNVHGNVTGLDHDGKDTPESVKSNPRLSDLFDRVNTLLGEAEIDPNETFRPKIPETLEETGLIFEEIERLILKYLYSKGAATGRQICGQLKLPFGIIDGILKQLKREQLVALKGSAAAGDYEFTSTDEGRVRAREYAHECSYFGTAPVSLKDYLKSMDTQSIARQDATEDDLQRAFEDLIISDKMFDRLGPAINSGRGMFLFGEPGNGKTSIAERVTRSFGSTIWIPRALGIDGDIMRLFDPNIHEEVEEAPKEGLFDLSGVDQRWVQIVRPTVIAGGELTMSQLEVTQNLQTKICEAPLQLKSNCGTLVIDDFGRQRMSVDELLNRWIVPLEKRYDFLNLPSGKKIQVPFDQLIVFSTNLEPRDLVDDAFLRRIPYKIEVGDPEENLFRELFKIMAPIIGVEYNETSLNYLIDTHYRAVERPFRCCQPRDLLLQIKNYCHYVKQPPVMSQENMDFAVENYFAVM